MNNPRQKNHLQRKSNDRKLQIGFRGVVIFAAVIIFLGIASSLVLDIMKNRTYQFTPDTPETYLPSSAHTLLENMAEKEQYLPETIQQIYEELYNRYEVFDFNLISLLRVMYDYSEILKPEDYKTLKKGILGFRYWMSDPGSDNLYFWSESRQILFSTAEYLAGKLFPDAIFTNAQLSGEEHTNRAENRILTWLQLKWEFGFSDWLSPESYIEMLAALSMLTDFSENEDISTKSAILMDLILTDIAIHIVDGTFSAPAGRISVTGKTTPSESVLQPVVRELLMPTSGEAGNNSGNEEGTGYNDAGIYLNFTLRNNYTIPQAIQEIARNTETVIHRTSQGLDLTELVSLGRISQTDSDIMLQFGMQAYTNTQVFTNTMNYLDANSLLGNEAFYGLRPLNYTILKITRLLNLFSLAVAPQANGTALQRANIYTYRTPFGSLATVQDYQPGTYGDMQHIWQAYLGGGAVIFSTHPAVAPTESDPNGLAPGYWTGSGHLPFSVQEGNINLTLYTLPSRKGLYEPELLKFTHVYFPENQFDEVIVQDSSIFARRNQSYISVIGSRQLQYGGPEGSRTDLVQEGQVTGWITEISNAEKESFSAFVNRIRTNTVEFSSAAIKYSSSGKALRLSSSGEFTIDGTAADTEYHRMDSDFAQALRNPDTISVFGEAGNLTLDFAGASRNEILVSK